jgi:anaerobic selenocysteine-containing dehydrogenase
VIYRPQRYSGFAHDSNRSRTAKQTDWHIMPKPGTARGEAKSSAEIFRLLAAGMGYDDPQFKMGDMELAEHYVKWDAPQMAGVNMAYFRKHGYFQLAVGTPDDRLPHANGNFPTPSGKVEFLVNDAKNFVAPSVSHDVRSDAVWRGNVDPLPGYVPPRSPTSNAPRAKLHRLNIISPKSHGFLNSCYANEPHKIRGQVEQFVMLSPAVVRTRTSAMARDSASRSSGSARILFSAAGIVPVRSRFSCATRPASSPGSRRDV